MAWEATYLLFLILLVFLASGSWAQDTELLEAVEGKPVSVKCRYDLTQRFMEKVWCRKTSRDACLFLATTAGTGAERLRHHIQDYPKSHIFTVNMTALKVRDAGLYYCGILANRREITVLKTIRLEVSKAPASWMTTALASTNSPVTDSPQDNWMWKVVIAGVAVAVLILLGLVLVVLYLRKARGRVQKAENECHHVYEDVSDQKEVTTGFSQQILSNEDTGTICYAALIHLNHVSPQDSIHSNSQPYRKPSPDPLMTVEYASISRNRLQSSKSASLEVETRS